MGVEIERKFLVRDEGWRKDAAHVRRIVQGYLTVSEPSSIRIRIEDGQDATLTIKSAEPGVVRREFVYKIPFTDADPLLGLCAGAIIEKLRHETLVGGMLWEIDVFLGLNAGLVVAEIELAEEGQAFERPSWLGAEITRDPRYYNAALARLPYTRWPRPAGAPAP